MIANLFSRVNSHRNNALGQYHDTKEQNKSERAILNTDNGKKDWQLTSFTNIWKIGIYTQVVASGLAFQPPAKGEISYWLVQIECWSNSLIPWPNDRVDYKQESAQLTAGLNNFSRNEIKAQKFEQQTVNHGPDSYEDETNRKK